MSIFVVHEHHSRNLHFDFRLEINGVLKSWAIPKGPSMNPQDKRLALLVDDHPLDYAHFEGIIPKGYYGAGSVYVWDNGEFEIIEGSVEKKKISINLKGKKLNGMFSIFEMKARENQWLLIKKADKYADDSFVIDLVKDTKKLKEEKPSFDFK